MIFGVRFKTCWAGHWFGDLELRKSDLSILLVTPLSSSISLLPLRPGSTASYEHILSYPGSDRCLPSTPRRIRFLEVPQVPASSTCCRLRSRNRRPSEPETFTPSIESSKPPNKVYINVLLLAPASTASCRVHTASASASSLSRTIKLLPASSTLQDFTNGRSALCTAHTIHTIELPHTLLFTKSTSNQIKLPQTAFTTCGTDTIKLQ